MVLVLALGLLLRLGFLWTADAEALVRVVPDDAFYYFQIARNLVAGHGATFDGLHPTNGYHPLWMLLLLPVAVLVSDPLLMVRVALTLGILLSLLSAALVHRIVSRMTGAWYVPLLALILYFLNPRSVASSLNGLETSLSTFLFTLLLHRILGELHAPADGRGRGWLTGVLLGLFFLARTDNAFFLAVFFLAAVAAAKRGRRLRRAAILAATAALVAAPWLAWNLARFGTPVQVSGVAAPYIEHELYRLQGHGPQEELVRSARNFLGFLSEGLRGEISYPRPLTAAILFFAVFAFAVRWRQPSVPAAARRAVLLLVGLGLGSLAHIFLHTFVRWLPRPWYFDQVMVLLPVLIGEAAAWCGAGSPLGSRPIRVLLALVLLTTAGGATVAGLGTVRTGDWPWQPQMLEGARWLRGHTEPDQVAAAFNAGILGFFSERRVVNLDGAVNNAAYAALRGKALWRHLRDSSAAFYVDFEPVMLKRLAAFLGAEADRPTLTSVHRVSGPASPWAESRVTVYRLDWPGDCEQ